MPIKEYQCLVDDFTNELNNSGVTEEDFEQLRVKYLGKKSLLKSFLNGLSAFELDEKVERAKELNQIKTSIESGIQDAKENFKKKSFDEKLKKEWLDMSMPGVVQERGSRHPLTIVENDLKAIFRQLGFELAEGPEIEDPYYNFDALNIPEHHPARDMQDTFWVTGGLLLRSHTTTVQARVLEKKAAFPIKIISPGKVYRNEAIDATHLACFHQFEGLHIDKGITLSHLMGTLKFAIGKIFGTEYKIRFKPKFYPYTEPSIGMDVACNFCNGDGCDACHHAGWVTIAGAGMVHPNVFKEFGYDHNEVSGYAFGMGISRIVAQFYSVKNFKSLYEYNLQVHKALTRGENI